MYRGKEHLCHLLHEAWRLTGWRRWIASSRNDAATCAAQQHDEGRCKLARAEAWASTAAFGFLSGAFASPATISRDGSLCDFCGEQIPTTEHLLWHCRYFEVNRPRKPNDSLQQRLGWPRWPRRGNKQQQQHPQHYDKAVITHCLRVRAGVLDRKYGHS